MSSFGPIVGNHTVQQAITSLLSQPPPDGQAPLIVYALAEVERQNSLPARTLPIPPGADSFYGGNDFESWNEALLPSIVVVCQPVGAPEHHEGGEEGQWFESQIAAIIQGDDEDQARLYANLYGTAIAKALLTFGRLGGLATETILTAAPKTEFMDNPSRVFQRAELTVQSYVQPILVAYDKPPTWAYDPYAPPGVYGEVETVNVEFTATAGSLSE